MSKRRKAIPMRIKLQVVLRQDGKCACGCGERLGAIERIEFDHNPALILRVWCAKSDDTIPPANDPDHIDALLIPCHRLKTNGKPHTTYGSDTHAATKIRHLQRGPKVSKHKIQSRPFDNRFSKKMNGDVVARTK